jgi:outer membrane receptor protein involved in Fe transport
MVKNLLIVTVLLLFANVAIFAQSGALKGKVLDKKSKEPVPFANIIVENNGTMAGGATSDINGEYTIKPLNPGKYDIKATFVGYKPVLIRGFVVRAEKVEFQNIEMESTAIEMTTFEVIDYKVPLISKDNTTTGASITSEEISKMPIRSTTAVAATVGGVFSRDGEVGSMRGQREEGNVTFIDGIRVRGLSGLPESAIEQVSVFLGGIPAQYGDATGGIINVTTKGPSRLFGGGLELQSSQFLDPYGYNRVGLNFTGPLFRNKDKTSSILGYFIAADLEYKKDGSPLALGKYKVKDDVLEDLEKNPLRPSPTGYGSYQNAEFIRMSDLEELQSTLNTNSYDLSSTVKFDVKSGKNSTLTLGGSFNGFDNMDYDWGHSIYNYKRNSHSVGNTWRVFGRYTQRFPADKESKSLIKNVYYSLQGDYTSIWAKSEDADLKDNLFGYGYVGKFDTYKIKGYDVAQDTLSPYGFRFIMNGFADTLVDYTRSDLNPIMANYTTNYYDLYKGDTPGHYDNVDNILLGGGLLNGYTPDAIFKGIYNMFSSPGEPQAGYGITDQKQITAALNISADVGNHEIKLGLSFERFESRNYNYAPTAFWPIMTQLTNSHITQLNLDDPYETSITLFDTFNIPATEYYRLNNAEGQRTFDKNLRALLNLPMDGLEWIDINSYDINTQTINYYDKDNNLVKNVPLSQPLSVNLFSPDEFLNGGSPFAAARGYDYYGNRLDYTPSIDDFFQKKDAQGNYLREIAPFEPIYMAGYIQDKFAFDDLVFNVGVRFDRFDANQSTLKDPYLLYPAKTVAEVKADGIDLGVIPTSMGNDYVVYIDNMENPSRITGYRDGSTWYNSSGSIVLDPSDRSQGIASDAGIAPYLLESDDPQITGKSFADYIPQWTIMPRISFSFPISDEALFYAHYDVLTQRPKTNFTFNPINYLFWPTAGNPTMNNPNLKPERTVDYELGYQQKLSNSSSINISGFYREFRDQIQSFRYTGAYPKTYYSYGNIDFGTVKGMTISYDLRRTINLRVRASYTLQFANGTGSSSETSSGLIRSGQPNLRTLIPYDYDRRHGFNLVVDFRYLDGKEYNGPVIGGKQVLKNAGFNVTINGGSGTPYTRSSLITPFGQGRIIQGSINGSRLPGSFRIDSRIDKDFTLATKQSSNGNVKEYYLNVYLQVLNVLNSKNIMGVYAATGNPDDDGYLAAAEYQAQINSQLDTESYKDMYRIRVNSPYNYSSPRMIRLGIELGF